MNLVARLGATILALTIAYPVFAQSTSPTGKTAEAGYARPGAASGVDPRAAHSSATACPTVRCCGGIAP
jgi:hypothetical protein